MNQQDRNDQGKFMQVYDEPLAKTSRCIRFPLTIDAILANMPDKSTFIREAVISRLREEGFLDETQGAE